LFYTFVALLLLGGCLPASSIKFDQPLATPEPYVSSAIKADDYPSFAFGEGNIYSCRYGIHFYSAAEFSPSKLQVFSSLLASAKPAIVAHKVQLDRFDVYHNWRLRLLSAAGNSMGGAVGATIARKADEKNNPTTSLPQFVLQENPGNEHGGDQENQIGCDAKGEGEYYPSQVNGGNDVIIVWLGFTVDGRPYSYRSMFQFHFDEAGGKDQAVGAAISATIREIAAGIVI
jgi:hypothetical protein